MPLTPGTISLSSKTSTAISLSATEATGGTAPYTRQWYRNTTGSAPVGGDAVAGATSLTLDDTGLAPSTTYFYFLNYADSASATAQATFSAATDATGALAPGTISLVSKTTTTINLSATEATGGSQPIAGHQWYRNTTGAPVVGGDILAGQTGLTLADTGLTPGTTYYYTLNYVDSASASTGTTFSTATDSVAPPTASLSVSPSAVGISSSGTLTFTDPAAHWLTTAPTFGTPSLAGFTLGAVTVTSDTTATATYAAGTTAGAVTFTESGAGVSATLTVTSGSLYQTAVPAGYFAPGLMGTVKYRVAFNGGAFGAWITAGVVEDIPGSYSGVFATAPGSTVKVEWNDGGSLYAVDYSPQVAASGAAGGGADSPGVATLLTRIAAPLTVTDGLISASFDAIGGVSIGPGIYTMRAPSTSGLVHFAADDAIANAGGGAGNLIEIVGGTGINNRFVGITSVSGVSGARDGVTNADASGYDDTTRYVWGDKIPAPGGTDLTESGLLHPGETGIQSMRKMLAQLAGSWDTTTNPGYATYFLGGVEMFRTALPTATGRAEAVNAGGL